MRKFFKILSALCFFVLPLATLQAQEGFNNRIESKREKIRFSTFGVGLHTLGLSQYNQVFSTMNIPETPAMAFTFYYSRMSLPVDAKVFTGFSVVSQNHLVVNERPGEISYTFARQNLEFNAGLFLVDNDVISVPLYGGAGFSFLIFNSHRNFDIQDKDFSDVLLDGNGTGIFNLTEIAVHGGLITGIDLKTSYFLKNISARDGSINIGIRTGISYAPFQISAGMPGVTGIPQTDKLNYFVNLSLTRFLYPCK